MAQDGELPDPVFRPSKRRKVYRKHVEDDEDDTAAAAGVASAVAPAPATGVPSPRAAGQPERIRHDDEDEEADMPSQSVAELIRQRKLNQRKKAGVEFNSNVEGTAVPLLAPDLALVPKDETPEIIKAIDNRFAQQTGRVTEETSLHMEAYIDREMQRRSQARPLISEDAPSAPDGVPTSPSSVAVRVRNPASQGKLLEIDLGPSNRLLNEARTEAAITGVPIESPRPPKPLKPRMGRNGKMYIPRPRSERNRRNSADVARDKVVEALLRENKLDVYEGDAEKVGNARQGADDEGAADDRLAEQFQKEYFDAQTQRKEKANKAAAGSGAGNKAGEERAKGPKLGGSRNARAAMKEREEAAARAAAANKGRR